MKILINAMNTNNNDYILLSESVDVADLKARTGNLVTGFKRIFTKVKQVFSKIASATHLDTIAMVLRDVVHDIFKSTPIVGKYVTNDYIKTLDRETEVKFISANLDTGNAIQSGMEAIKWILDTLGEVISSIFDSIKSAELLIFNKPKVGAIPDAVINMINSSYQIEYFKQLYKIMQMASIPDRFITAYLILLSFSVPYYVITKVYKFGFSETKNKDYEEDTVDDEFINKGSSQAVLNKSGLNEMEAALLRNVQKVIVKYKEAETDIEKDLKLAKILIRETLWIWLPIVLAFIPAVLAKFIGSVTSWTGFDASKNSYVLIAEKYIYLFLTVAYIYFIVASLIMTTIATNDSQKENSKSEKRR